MVILKAEVFQNVYARDIREHISNKPGSRYVIDWQGNDPIMDTRH